MPSEKQCCPTDAPPVRNPYTPTGESFYMTGPLDSKKAIIIAGDVFGIQTNAKRYADILAKEGFLVLYPDFMKDYALDMNNFVMDKTSEKYKKFFEYTRNFDFHMGLARQSCALLRKLGVQKIATLGLCWGARIAFDLAGEGLVDAASSAHPSLLTVERLAPAAKVPVCILPSKDENAEDMAAIEKAINAHAVEPHVYKTYDKLTHGFFGNRFDYDKCTPEEKEQFDDATRVSIDFFKKALA